MWEFIENAYDDVGNTIKKIVKGIFALTFVLVVIGTVIGEIALFFQYIEYEVGAILVAMIILPIFSGLFLLSIWLGSLMTYNMGEISDRVAKIEDTVNPKVFNKPRKITPPMQPEVASHNGQATSNEQNKSVSNILEGPAEVVEGIWRCKYCDAKNLESRTICWSCDKPNQ